MSETKWEPEQIAFYLSIYYSDVPDWTKVLGEFQANERKYNSTTTRKKIAFTILSGIKPLEEPERLLYGCFKIDMFKDVDNWVTRLDEIIQRDLAIAESRKMFLEEGFIAPPEYHPRSRQVLKWLEESAKTDPSITKETFPEVMQRMKNLVLIYGPTSVGTLYNKGEMKAQLHKEAKSWRTGYFVEAALHEHFGVDKLLELKKRDISQAPEYLVKYSAAKAQTL